MDRLSKFINKIGEEKKPIVFHNGLLDLMHLYNRTFGHLP